MNDLNWNGDYLGLAMTPEQIEWDNTIVFLTRALLYVKGRRPYEYPTLEIFQDRIDAMEGERRAKLIN